MMTHPSRPFTASTNKLAYAQAFSGNAASHRAEHRSLLRRISTRRTRTRTV